VLLTIHALGASRGLLSLIFEALRLIGGGHAGSGEANLRA